MGFSGRSILKKVTHFLGNCAYKSKLKKHPEKFFTLRELFDKVGVDTECLEKNIKEKLDTTVSYVCRYSDRFTKNCVCVQICEDPDNLMKKAAAEGALLCITKRKIEGIDCMVVPDTESLYAKLCAVVRETSDVKTTVVAGSIGKTTTKKMIDAVYSRGFNTLCDSGNDNIIDSVGSICQHIPENAQQLVCEFSEDTPGLIKEMSRITKPNIAVITTIDKSHILYYGSKENIFNEFRSITEYMREDGVCIMSLDSLNAQSLIKDRKVIYVSIEDKEADFFGFDITIDNEGLDFSVLEKSTGNTYKVKLYNTFAKHNVTSALLAFAAGVQSGMNRDDIIKGLSDYRATGIRQNVYKSGKTVVYADCYNAVAKSIRSAMNAAQIIPINGKRIAVLGDVAEAGEYTQSTHLEIVDIINESKFDMVFTFGKELIDAISKSEMRDSVSIHTFKNQKDMNKALKKTMKSGDLVLFKASHSGNLEASVRAVFPFAYFAQAIKYYMPRIKWHFKVILN